jgi:hypothetical protein
VVWLIRGIAVGLFVLYGPLLRPQSHDPLSMKLLTGFLTGLFVIGVAALIGKLGKRISARTPVGAKRVGVGLYWLGSGIAVACLAMSALAAYEGASVTIIGILASFAIAYWALAGVFAAP